MAKRFLIGKMDKYVTIRTFLLLTAWLIVGCGEPDRPHFVPASAIGPGQATDAPRSPTKPSREVAIPRNIETH